MFHDLRFALASIRRRPLVAAAVILVLGLGLGANAAIFRAFSAAFLRPLPFQGEERLVRIYLGAEGASSGLSPRPDVFLALRDHSRSFSTIAGQRFNDFTLVSGGEPQRVRGIEVSEDWARTLGVSPQLGRTFARDEERHASAVALISDSMWRGRFAARPDIVGTSLSLDGRPFTIIGVLPPGLRFPYESEVWIPARFDTPAESTWALHIVARLHDDVTLAAAREDLRALSTRLPEVKAQQGMVLLPVPLRDTLVDDQGPIVISVTVAAGFLLLLVAVNVAHLLAAHSLSRQREFAIRTALGAGFTRHLRQTMTEGLVLATMAGAVGLSIAYASESLLAVLVPENFAYVFERPPFDARVLLFMTAVIIATGCVFGVIPALRVARRDPQAALIGAGRTTDTPQARRGAMVATAGQLALALLLLVAAHSMIRDVQRRLDQDLGYDPRGVLTASIILPPQRYPGAEERGRFYDRLSEAMQGIPGVEAAGTVNLFPAAGQGALLARIEGEGVPYDADAPLLTHNRMVHGRLADAMGLRLVAGRMMTEDELRRGDAVAVISRELARTLWPDQDPLGKRVRNRRIEDAPWLRVVGVVGDLEEFYADTTRAVWQPVQMHAASAATAQASLVLRSPARPESLASALRATVRRIDPALAVFEIATAEQLYRDSLTGRQSARVLTGAFAALGLLVAAIGVYASMAFAMSRRTRELAVRMALGATSSDLARQFLGNAAMVVGSGVVGGIFATIALAKIGRSVAADFPISATSFVLAAAILAAVALLASWLPLRRALRLDPITTLRTD
jgi:putative ABC transport system permease protein